MDIKKINIRKSEVSLGNVALTSILIIACFMGMFYYWNFNMEDSGETMSSEYTNMSAKLNNSQANMNNNFQAIKTNIDTVTEPEVGLFAVAINGLKGLGNILKAPVFMITATYDIFETFYDSLTFLPGWVKMSATLGLLILIILLIVAILAGANNKISK